MGPAIHWRPAAEPTGRAAARRPTPAPRQAPMGGPAQARPTVTGRGSTGHERPRPHHGSGTRHLGRHLAAQRPSVAGSCGSGHEGPGSSGARRRRHCLAPA
ncbi:hypothetical protein SEVIR_2G227650v4 [Setaria viridis]